MIRVFLVEDQTLVREGIRSLLALDPEIAVTGEAADGAAAVDAIPSSGADVVLLDMRLPRMSGLEVLRALCDSLVDVPEQCFRVRDPHFPVDHPGLPSIACRFNNGERVESVAPHVA